MASGSTSVERLWSGRSPASTALLPFSWAFRGVVHLRRRLFSQGVLSSHSLPVAVIVVGNLLVGGAGKTPAVIAIVDLLRRHGAKDDIPNLAGETPRALAGRIGDPTFTAN